MKWPIISIKNLSNMRFVIYANVYLMNWPNIKVLSNRMFCWLDGFLVHPLHRCSNDKLIIICYYKVQNCWNHIYSFKGSLFDVTNLVDIVWEEPIINTFVPLISCKISRMAVTRAYLLRSLRSTFRLCRKQ